MMSVTNISGTNFDTQLINNIVNNNDLQQTLINNIPTEIKNKGYYGVIIDFERIAPENREKYNYFDDNGREYIVWFEDARSVEAKYKLAF